MTPREPFRLPETAYSFKSVDAFLQQSQIRLDKIAQAQGKSSPKISPQDITVDPGETGDGMYQLVYQNKALDAVLLGQVSTLNQEIKLVNHRIDKPENYFIFHYDKVDDACSLTSTLLGKDELAGLDCKDGWLDPNLKSAQKSFDSITVFDRYCQKAYGKFLQEHPEFKGTGDFSLNRTVVHNPEAGDAQFNLLYHNPANDFFCRAEVPTFGEQIMVMGAGMVHDGGKQVSLIGDPETHEMTDACRMTDALVGKEEHPGDCKEFTPGERTGTKAVEYTWNGFWIALTSYEGASLLTWTADKVFKRGWYAKSFGKWPHPGKWMARQVWRPLQAGGRLLRGLPAQARALAPWARNVALPSLRSLATRLPTLARFAPVGAGAAAAATETTTAVAAGTGVAGAGVGSGTAAVASAKLLAAFGVGVGVGIGIEKGQVALFGKSYTSEYIAEKLQKKFGKPKPEWVDWWDENMSWLP